MTNQIQSVSFHNQQITVLNHNNKPYVAMKSIVENIGLNWVGQLQRIKRHHVLSKGMCMIHIPTNGGFQEYACLPLSMINGWLFGIDTNRVKPQIKSRLEQYQLECFDVLYNHFMPKVARQYPNTISLEQQQAIKQAVNERAYRTGEHYQAIYSKLYEQFKIPRYQDLPAIKFDEAIKFLGGARIKSEQFTDDELCSLAWCYKAGEIMRQRIQQVTEALYQLQSPFAPAFYSMGVEYKRTLESARVLINRETKHIQLENQSNNYRDWANVLTELRNKPKSILIN